MRCIKCNVDIGESRCSKCGKSFYEVGIENMEKYESDKNYEKAAEILKELNKHDLTVNEKEDIAKRLKIVRLEQRDYEENKFGIEKNGTKNIKEKNIKRSKNYFWIYIGIMLLPFGIFIFKDNIVNYIEKAWLNHYVGKYEMPLKKIGDKMLYNAYFIDFDDGFYPTAEIAAKWGYEKLLKKANEKKVKLTIGISGNTLMGVRKVRREIIDEIKQGINGGYFEIIGGHYSRITPYSLNNDIYRSGVIKEKKILERTFGIKIEGFHFAGEVISAEAMAIVKKAGYSYIIADKNAIVTEKSVKRDTFKDKKTGLTVILTDGSYSELLNKAVDSGDNDFNKDGEQRGANISVERKEFVKLIEYMRKKYRDEENKKLVYSGNGDKFGVTDEYARKNPEWDIKNFEFILNNFDNMKWVESKTISGLIRNSKKEEVLIKEFRTTSFDKEIKIANPKYSTYEEYMKKSDKIAYYKSIFENYYRNMLRDGESKNSVEKNFEEELFFTHIHKFGFPLTGGTDIDFSYDNKVSVWEGIKDGAIYFEELQKEQFYTKIGDYNGDGINELLVKSEEYLYLFSIKNGGRLLYWANIKKNIEYVGSLITELNFENINYNINLPVNGYEARRFEVIREKYFDGNIRGKIFEFEFARFIIGDDALKSYFDKKRYIERQRALNETIILNSAGDGKYEDREIRLYNSEVNMKIDGNKITFENDFYVKKIEILKTGFEAEYKINKEAEGIRIENEINMISIGENGYLAAENVQATENKIEVSGSGKSDKIEITADQKIGLKIEDAMLGKYLTLEFKAMKLKLKFSVKEDEE